jgi:hypothetical protein
MVAISESLCFTTEPKRYAKLINAHCSLDGADGHDDGVALTWGNAAADVDVDDSIDDVDTILLLLILILLLPIITGGRGLSSTSLSIVIG